MEFRSAKCISLAILCIASIVLPASAAIVISNLQGTMLGTDGGIVLVNTQTSAKTKIIIGDTMNRLTGGYANGFQLPRFSPDGKQVVFWHDWWYSDWSAKAPGAMFIADNDGKNITRICDAVVAHAGIDYQSLSWCTDGYIYFSRQTDTIFRVDPTTKQVQVYWVNVGVPGYHTGSSYTADPLLNGPYVENLVVTRDATKGASSNGGHIHALDLVNKRLIETCGGGCRGSITTNGDQLVHWLTCCGYYPPGYDGSNSFLRVTVLHKMTSCDSVSYMYAPGCAAGPNASADQYWMYRGACNSNDYLAGQGYGNNNGVLQNKNTSDYLIIPSYVGTDFYLGALPPPPAATPMIKLDSTQISIMAPGAGTPAAKNVTVTNSGTGTLTNVTVTENASWLTVTRSGSGNTQTLSNAVSLSGLSKGVYSAVVTVSGGGAGNSVNYTVYLNVGSAVPAPTGLTAALVNNFNIILHWQDNSTGENGFIVERMTGTGPWTRVRSLAANTATFTDSSLVAATYTYRLAAYAGTDTSGYSNQASATVTATITITATKPAAGDILFAKSQDTIKWTGQNSGGIYIEYSLDDGIEWTRIITGTRGSIKPTDADWGKYVWTVPDTQSTLCLVHVVEYANHAISGLSGRFTIKRKPVSVSGTAIGRIHGSQVLGILINKALVTIAEPQSMTRDGTRTLTIVDNKGRQVFRGVIRGAGITIPVRINKGTYVISVRGDDAGCVSQKILVR